MNSSQALSRGGPLLHSDWELLGTVSSLFYPGTFIYKVLLHPLSHFICTTPLQGRMEGVIIPFERWNH